MTSEARPGCSTVAEPPDCPLVNSGRQGRRRAQGNRQRESRISTAIVSGKGRPGHPVHLGHGLVVENRAKPTAPEGGSL